MSGEKLRLEVVFAAVDQFIRPVNGITKGASEAAKALRDTKDQLKQLNDQQSRVSAFKETLLNARKASEAVRTTQDEIAKLKARLDGQREAQARVAGEVRVARNAYQSLFSAIQKIPAPAPHLLKNLALQKEALAVLETKYGKAQNATRRMKEELKDLNKSASDAKRYKDGLSDSLRNATVRLKEVGFSTKGLADQERDLAKATEAATKASENHEAALARENKKMERLKAAQAVLEDRKKFAGKMAVSGAALAAGGAAMTLQVNSLTGEAKHYALEVERIKALGLGEHASQDAVKFASAMKTYGTSARENLELMRDAMTIFADEHHAQMVLPTLAKMKFANKAIYGDEAGADSSRKFMDMLKVIELRGGTSSQQRFEHEADLVQKVITATGGRVGPEQWLDFIKTGGLAAKGLDDKSFFYRMEPLIQEMGGHSVGTGLMSAYQNLYQGKTTVRAARYAESLGILDPKMVEYDKVGQLKRVKPGALREGELFQTNPVAWLDNVLLPTLAQHGVTGEREIKDALGTLFSNRTASNLFATMYLQRGQIEKSARLNAGADGITELEDKAKGTAQGKELALQARKNDLYREMGDKILPMYVKGLEKTAAALDLVTGFMKDHPTLAKGMAVGFAGIAGLAVGLGGLALAASAVLGPMAMLKFFMTTLGISAPLAGIRIGTLSTHMSRVRVAAQEMGSRIMQAWQAAAPGSGGGSFKTLLASIADAAKKAASGTREWGADLGSNLKMRLAGARTAVASYTREVWASIVATRAAAATKFSASVSYARSRGIAGLGADAAMGVFNFLKGGAQGAIGRVATVLRSVGQALIFVGRAALMNPIGLAITGIALAAMLVIKYWEPIKAFFSGFWSGLKEGLAPLGGMFGRFFSAIGEVLAPLRPVWDWLIGALSSAWEWVSKLFVPFKSTAKEIEGATQNGRAFGLFLGELAVAAAELVGKMFGIGRDIVGGLINGIASMFDRLKSTFTGLGDSSISWLKEKLGIHSPSRVFAELGGFTMEGFEQGLRGGEGGPLKAVGDMARKLAGLGAGVAISGAAMAGGIALDTRPPLGAAPAAAGAGGGNTYQIHIHAAPGQDERSIAALVGREIERIEHAKAARARGRLRDAE